MIKILLVFLVILNAQSQNDIYKPINFMNAEKKGTRTLLGKPGENYWQNKADYNIRVKINPFDRLLEGSESVIYYNNSPDTLKEIVIRVYQNIQKAKAARDMAFKDETITEGMNITKLIIDSQNYDTNDKEKVKVDGTNIIVNLEKSILPSTESLLEIDWNFTIPKKAWRLGYYDSTSAFVAYWYPQVSVYDDIDGWDKVSYKGIAEMYNDFNNYSVSISLPSGYNVWATGELLNEDKIYTINILEKLNLAFDSDSIVNIINEEDYKKKNVFQAKDELTYSFDANEVPDFAFGFSDHYMWDAGSIQSGSGERIRISSVFKKESEDFYEATHAAKKAIKYFEDNLPGIPFPYKRIVQFNGSGGMEFPMIVNNGSTSKHSDMVGLVSHELLHQYFPFAAGINEKKYAWMDEGLAVMIPFEHQIKYGYDRKLHAVSSYEIVAGTENDMPPTIVSYHIQLPNSRNSSYNRPATAFLFLMDILGENIFKDAIGEFYNRWVGKHPTPYDLFSTVESISKKDLGWFWKPWLFEYGYPDLAISDYSVHRSNSNSNEITITIERKGNIPVPIKLLLNFADGTHKIVTRTAEVWNQANSTYTLGCSSAEELISIELGDKYIPDVDRANNRIVLNK